MAELLGQSLGTAFGGWTGKHKHRVFSIQTIYQWPQFSTVNSSEIFCQYAPGFHIEPIIIYSPQPQNPLHQTTATSVVLLG